MKHFILLFTLLFSFNSINAFDPSKLGEDLLKSIPGNVVDELKKNIPAVEPPQKDIPQKTPQKTEKIQKPNLPKVAKWNVEEIKKLKCTNEKLNDVVFVSKKEYLEKIDKTVLMRPEDKDNFLQYVYLDSKAKKGQSIVRGGNKKDEINMEDLLPITQANSNPVSTLNFYFKDLNKCFSSDFLYTMGTTVAAFFRKENKYFFIDNPLKILKDEDRIMNTADDPRVFYLYENSGRWLSNFKELAPWEVVDTNSKGIKDYVNKLNKKEKTKLTSLEYIEKNGYCPPTMKGACLAGVYWYTHFANYICVDNEILSKNDPIFSRLKKTVNKVAEVMFLQNDQPKNTWDKIKDISFDRGYDLMLEENMESAEKTRLYHSSMKGDIRVINQCHKTINDSMLQPLQALLAKEELELKKMQTNSDSRPKRDF